MVSVGLAAGVSLPVPELPGRAVGPASAPPVAVGEALATERLRPIVVRHDLPDSAFIALADSFPTLVHLNLPDAHGVLIGRRWVLTAAHVAVEVPPGHSLTIAGHEYPAERVFLHPGWPEGDYELNDLALILLKRPVETVEPAPIYRDDDEEGRVLYVVGTGRRGTGLTGAEESDGIARAATNLVDEATPRALWFRFDDPRESRRATALEGISGPGDSGGPGYVAVEGGYAVAGISSGQDTMGRPRVSMYGVLERYTRVSAFASWIDSVITLAERPGSPG